MSSRSSLISWLLLLGCTASPPAAPPQASPSPPAAPEVPVVTPAPESTAAHEPKPAPATDCDALSRVKCLASPVCTLEATRGARYPYRCRPAVAPCEIDIVQADLGDATKSASGTCESRPGCRVQPGRCYCACRSDNQTPAPDEGPDCDCVCGAGPPATCTDAPAADAR